MNPTRELVLQRLRWAKPVLQAEFPLKGLALFGSYTRGTEVSGKSDVSSKHFSCIFVFNVGGSLVCSGRK